MSWIGSISFINFQSILPNILRIIANWGRWSEMAAVKLPDIISGSVTFENILSIRVSEWLVILAGCKTNGKNELEAREPKSL